ncbi:hypothetical protein HZS_6120 [Henneguya salminicola]|nr:hypothetical protein HZS_6120 [Henneguya salminicola]
MKYISIIPQESRIFDNTIKHNILYGNMKCNPSQVVKVATQAQAHNFIMDLKNEYNTIIGTGGSDISGGERKRVCIARSLLKKSNILLIDEATAFLDATTASKIIDILLEENNSTTHHHLMHNNSDYNKFWHGISD